jgi:hypothetical protein
MSKYIKFSIFSILVLVIAACGSQAAGPAADKPLDLDGLTSALAEQGAAVTENGTVLQPFFEPEGQVLSINGQDVQVFEFASQEAALEAAGTIAADGGSVGTSMMAWMDTPHFFQSGRLILLYVGSDGATLDLLSAAAGPQIAGG